VLPRPGKCETLNYLLQSEGNPISGALAAKLIYSSGILNFDTDIPGASEVVEFTIRGQVDGAPTNTADRAVKVYVGCHAATALTTSVTIPANDPHITASSEDGESLKLLVFPTAQDQTSWDLQLTSVFKWTSDVTDCAANTVSEVTDSGTAVSEVSSYQITNPTSGATGTFDPYLNVSLSTGIDKMIYLKGTSSSKFDLEGGVSETFKVLLRVCGNEQIAVLSNDPIVLSESVSATV
jgi:hypothetical protein